MFTRILSAQRTIYMLPNPAGVIFGSRPQANELVERFDPTGALRGLFEFDLKP
jgi:hypothetical protein